MKKNHKGDHRNAHDDHHNAGKHPHQHDHQKNNDHDGHGHHEYIREVMNMAMGDMAAMRAMIIRAIMK